VALGYLGDMMRKCALIACLVGCVPELEPPVERALADDDTTEDPSVGFEPIGDVAWATRASLELRGVRPTIADLERAAAGEAEDVVESYVQDERLGRRLAWLYNDHLHTALFFDNSTTRDWSELSGEERHAVGWEPLALVEHVVNHDLPVTALVTADELLRNDTGAVDLSDASAWRVVTARLFGPPPAEGPLQTGMTGSRIVVEEALCPGRDAAS
jgi:hypothetical protein